MVQTELLQLGAVAVIFLFAIKEFFAFMRSRKNGNGFNEKILNELRTMNSNHLSGIYKAIDDGNKKLTESMHNDNIRIIELLGEIKGKLSK